MVRMFSSIKLTIILFILSGCGHFINPTHRGFLDWNSNYIYEQNKEQVVYLCSEKYKDDRSYKECLRQNGY